jgi:hypothetical protein
MVATFRLESFSFPSRKSDGFEKQAHEKIFGLEE